MLELTGIYAYLIPIGALLILAFATAVLYEINSFSMNIFLATIAVGMGVLIWIGAFPVYGFALSGLCIIGIVFSRGGPDE